jgi:2-methylcitrate dehydratase PrpD
MNKIVREHYPVEKLPEDLRRLVPQASEVTLEITFAAERHPMTGAEAATLMREQRKSVQEKGRTMEEIVREVRELRDEWED